MAKDKRDKLILILILVVAALLLVLAFIFLILPAINGMVVQGQSQGYNYAVEQLFSLASQCQKIPITFENQTINLVAVECLQKQAS